MNLERVGGREEGQGNGSKGETKAECKKLVEELRVEDTVVYNEMFRMNCEAFEEILTSFRSAITKTADRKTVMNYPTRGQTRKTIINYHEEFEDAQKK